METTSLFLTDGWTGPQNVMLDLETWGTAPGSALRSIGAVMFDPYTAEIGEEFYANIFDESCLKVGLVKDAGTIEWWGRQSQQAQDALLVNQCSLIDVATRFNAWWRKNRAVFVWGQGSNFDPVLWEAALRVIHFQPPWKFYDTRDTRTAYDIAGFNPKSVKRAGTYHNALDDARHQAVCVQSSYAKVMDQTQKLKVSDGRLV